MREVGIGDPRNDRPSYQGLARASNVAAETVRQMIIGGRVPEPENVKRVAKALNKDVREVSAWVNQRRSVLSDYEVPAEVALLDQDERDAITNLIRVMAKSKRPAKPRRRLVPVPATPEVTTPEPERRAPWAAMHEVAEQSDIDENEEPDI